MAENSFFPHKAEKIDPYDRSIQKITHAKMATKKMRGVHGSPPPHSALNKKLQQEFYSRLDNKLIDMMQSVPEHAKESVIYKWKE